MTFNASFIDQAASALTAAPGMGVRENRDALIQQLGDFAGGLQRVNPPKLDFRSVLEQLVDIGQLTDPDQHAVVRLLELAADAAEGTKHRDKLLNLARAAELLEEQPAPAPVEWQLEAVVLEDNRVDFAFVEGAYKAARAVARLTLRDERGRRSLGTGWLLTPEHIVTNWHVVACKEPIVDADWLADRARKAEVRFEIFLPDDEGIDAGPVELVTFSRELDFAILKLARPATGRVPLRLATTPVSMGMAVNIPQYGPGPIRFALRENVVVSVPSDAHRVHYISDTQPGASGSPVCDDRWCVVALHHAAVNVPAKVLQGRSFNVQNQGIPIHAIRAKLEELTDVWEYIAGNQG